ncbi:hypothetical protein CVV26_00600 [Candidatus Kuenenbacteria bacterium HGW-Kuenenbacteria-1]|uniref:Type II secretion system protein n=1 Tax=Candidatus Kuenenbacteria bacterium HGW-Kuenenbacteria-1 TaxID=2013812 RepID=A0A2N1UPD1_9BACT|nr:MAG: hypothetical protein CVV26_00600 [Candidatus Kuenenbacteria bacterium HGW-Kuenenbacteria-1]
MKIKSKHNFFNLTLNKGFSLVEIILVSAIFVLLVTTFVGAYLYAQEASVFAGNRVRATMLAEEGLEATRNIRDANFNNLTDANHGLVISGNQWNFSGSQDMNDIFTRQIIISSIDLNRKNIISNITWQQNPQRVGLVSLSSRMTNWQKSAPVPGSCNDYAVQQGYVSGICRQNEQQCVKYNEIYLSGGDSFCTIPSADTCCAK